MSNFSGVVYIGLKIRKYDANIADVKVTFWQKEFFCLLFVATLKIFCSSIKREQKHKIDSVSVPVADSALCDNKPLRDFFNKQKSIGNFGEKIRTFKTI